jgi:uncharacterized protein (TIGR03083 family)
MSDDPHEHGDLDHLARLGVDLEAFARAVEHGPADAMVVGCPGWTLVDLGDHLGQIHRWVIGAITTGGPPEPGLAGEAAPTNDLDALAAWFREGAERLLTLLASTDPSAPTWHPFLVEPKVAGLWRRRQAHEACVHRWDAEHAIGRPAVIAAEMAADGVDEYWTVMLPRMLTREGRSTPATTIAVELTDTAERWVVCGDSGLPVLDAAADPVALLRSDAESVLLALWGRPSARPLTISGDGDALAAWLALGGA